MLSDAMLEVGPGVDVLRLRGGVRSVVGAASCEPVKTHGILLRR